MNAREKRLFLALSEVVAQIGRMANGVGLTLVSELQNAIEDCESHDESGRKELQPTLRRKF